MAVIKGNAEIRTRSGIVVGRGIAYVHLPRGRDQQQIASGTISCRAWQPEAGDPTELAINGGPVISINVSSEAISDCSRNRILRYTAAWDPASN